MVETHPASPAPDAPPLPRSRNPFFPLVAVISAVFIITILALVSGLYGNPEAPVTKWLDLYGGRLIGAEILVFVMISVAALVTDRRQTLRERNQSSPTRAASPASKPDFH